MKLMLHNFPKTYIYVVFIRSCTEYCAVVFHSSLTVEQTASLERIQNTCLKVILSENYTSYEAALEMTGLETLYSRRENRCLDFSLKCLKHVKNYRLFPMNPTLKNEKYNIRNRELFKVNFAKTESYRNSAIPYCQRKLNELVAEIATPQLKPVLN